ncbi:hypothetical protein BRD15_01145 [Halobacteriales archaeon SW_6_65_15]|jgi:uncharacterized protein with GYD domain|nr:MAG: hypothetical protein BRD15_01145 [Halobacteriales archaeon SW_6_65_15]
MPTYVTLFKHTQEGKEGIERIPDVYQEVTEQFRAMGAENMGVYYGSMGEYDGFGIMEVPDGETAETIRLAFEREGTHHFENYEVFEAEEYFEMIEEGTS